MEAIKKYRHYLKQFKKFIGEEPATKEMVSLWKTNLREYVTPVIINCAIAVLNGFFKYCGWGDRESKFLKTSKSSLYPERKELTEDECKRLVKTALDNGDGRLAFVLEAICADGIHILELPFTTAVAIHKGRAEIECKGRVRIVLLTRQLCSLPHSHTQENNINSGMAFVTKNGKPLGRSNIWREMRALGIEANAKTEKILPYNLRHLFARTYYEIEKNLSKLADILGHRDTNTTRVYTKGSGS